MKKAGFTLIELLVVVIVLGILAAIAIPKLISNIEKSKLGKAQGDIAAYNKALESYRASSDKQTYPTALSAIHPTWMGGADVLEDPWGNNYDYSSDGNKYTLKAVSATSGGKTVIYTSEDGIMTVQ